MKLKFKHQPFQAEAAAAVCDVFNDQPLRTANYRIDLGDTTNMQQRMDFSEVGFRNHPLVPELTRSRILENLRAVQIRNNLKPSDALAGPGINLTIEMETGTGKTYTYVKTMYELNRRYGWSKFIIVVPSVAIREGVAKSLETTQQHFSDEYGKKIRFFTYSSDKLTEVDSFASDSGIYAMIINMQAFNSSKNQTDHRQKAGQLPQPPSHRHHRPNQPDPDHRRATERGGQTDQGKPKKVQRSVHAALFRHPQRKIRYGLPPGRYGCLQPASGQKDRGVGHHADRYYRHQ